MPRRSFIGMTRPRTTPVRAVGDSAATPQGQAVVIDVLANDVGTGLEIVAVGTPNVGTAEIGTGPNAGKIVYTPPAGFFGEATFSYTIEDGDGNQSNGGVVVVVANVDLPPTAIVSSLGPSITLSNTAANNAAITRLSLSGNTPDGSGTWSVVDGGWPKADLSASTGTFVDLLVNDSDGLAVGDNGAKFTTIRYTGEGLAEPLEISLTINVVTSSNLWTGPLSKQPWYSGSFNRNVALDALRTHPSNGKKSRLDVLTTFHRRGGWNVWGASAAQAWKTAGPNSLWYQFLLDDNTPAVSIAIQPFCSDANLAGASDPNNTLSTWPAKGSIPLNAWISPNRPVAYQASGLTSAQKRERHMDVWQYALAGHFDHIWEPQLIAFRNAIPLLASKRIIWRPWWESNGSNNYNTVGGGLWGTTKNITSSAPLGGMRTAEDLAVIKGVYAHFNDIIRSVFPNNSWFSWSCLRSTVTAASIWPGEPAYGNTMDLIDPLKWDFIGPDFYDRDDIQGPGETKDAKNTGPTSLGLDGGTFEDRWDQIAFAGTQAAPKGIVRWFEWLRNVARPINPNVLMGIGEWGVWRLATDHQGTAGDDNPVYIARMYDLMAANSDIMGYEAYYNNRKGDGTEETMLTVSGGGTFFPNASAMYRTKWVQVL